MKIVFMGTPEFAVPSLEILIQEGYKVEAVITAPDKPAGRGRVIQMSPVKEFAVAHQIPVWQPEKLKSPGFLEEYRQLAPDLNIVVAFRMLPRDIWAFPKLGTFNLHASLLPQYRGAAPINHAIINGETETGITTFMIDEEIDTGRIILSRKIAIHQDETAGELHDRMKTEGADLVLQTVRLIEKGGFSLTDQSQVIDNKNIVLKPAPKIFREDCRINWKKTVVEIKNMIHGLSPFPGAFTHITDANGREMQIKIYKAAVLTGTEGSENISLETDGRSYIHIHGNGGVLAIQTLQAEGKKRMETEEFLRGFPLLQGNWKVTG